MSTAVYSRSLAVDSPGNRCPLCGKAAIERVRLPHTQVMECSSSTCKLMFSSPQLDCSELEAAYRKFYYPSPDSGVVVYENTSEEILCQVFDRMEAQWGRLKGKELLDFGCGVGNLCHVASEYALCTTGTEPDTNARELANSTGRCKAYA